MDSHLSNWTVRIRVRNHERYLVCSCTKKIVFDSIVLNPHALHQVIKLSIASYLLTRKISSSYRFLTFFEKHWALLWNHCLFRENTINLVSSSRKRYKFTEIYYEFTISFAIILWIHYLLRDFFNRFYYSPIHTEFSICIPNSLWNNFLFWLEYKIYNKFIIYFGN